MNKFIYHCCCRCGREWITLCLSSRWIRKVYFWLLVIFSVGSVYTIGNEFSVVKGTTTTDNQDKVFVIYAGSLVKIFEDIIGSAFQNETGYI